MSSNLKFPAIVVTLMLSLPLLAQCPLDHLIIGCNRDGINDTDDDRTLFVDCQDKYRNSGPIEYLNWYYPLRESIFPEYPYRIGEPGFDTFQADNPNEGHTYDPNRALAGVPDEDYRIIIECAAISPGLRVQHKNYPQFTIDRPGDGFNHSQISKLLGSSHIHLSFQADTNRKLRWVTFLVYDAIDGSPRYKPSEPVTIVFNLDPLPGDLVVDCEVTATDLYRLAHYWLKDGASIENDYYERSDTNRDGKVDFIDYANLALSWRQSLHTGF